MDHHHHHLRSARTREKETSPNRAKVSLQPVHPKIKPIKRVQVVYYLSRNGQLEHPHYIEVTHFANQHLRLRDVMDRLTVLRGKGMPSLYSWSCKRSYKNGYVWNDLAENDIIYPSDGAEYVLKGSELVEGCSERFQQIQVTNNNRQLIQDPNLDARSKQLGPSHQLKQHEETHKTKYVYEDYEEEQEQESQEEYEDEDKTTSTTSTTPHSRCSRGVSTEELEEEQLTKNPTTTTTESTLPQDSSSSPSIHSDKTHQKPTSKRFEDGDTIATESAPSRNSVLRQLISCGNLAVAKAKDNANGNGNAPSLRQPAVKVKSNSNIEVKRSSENNLHKGVLCKTAVKVGVAEDEDMIISCMSENPRFGNLQAEDKEYFSGSIVESMSQNRVAAEPVFKRSNSYNEERSTKDREGEEEEEIKDMKASRAKCIPLKKASSSYSCSLLSKQAKK